MSKRQEVVNAREIEQQHKNERERLKSQILERRQNKRNKKTSSNPKMSRLTHNMPFWFQLKAG
jgi:hypothetical protein